MNVSRAGTLVAIVAACAGLAACSGGSSAPTIAALATAPTPGQMPQGAGTVPYGRDLLNGASYAGAAHVATIGLDVFATMRDAAGLAEYAKAANDPTSPVYRQWLTPEAIGERFGASVSDYTALAAYLTSNGIAVKSYPQRQMLRIAGPQANVERALGTSFGVYRRGTRTFLAPATAPRIAPSLHVAALGNAVGYTTRTRDNVPVRAGNAFVQGYSPQQIANAFDFTGAYNAGYRGAGISIGIIATGPVTDGDPRVAVGDAADYKRMYGIGGAGSIQQVVDTSNVSPGTGANGSSYSKTLATPPPVTSPVSAGCQKQGYDPNNPATRANITDLTTCNPEDIEVQLDTEQAAALAPDSNVLVYVAYNPTECFGTCGATGSAAPSPQIGLPLSDDEIQQAIADNRSDIISMSFGGSEPTSQGVFFGAGSNNYGPTEFASLASMGVALFASSGDAGAEGCQGDTGSGSVPNGLCVGYPATDPSVVSVGGVNAPLDNSGRLVGPMTGWGAQTQIAGSTPGGSGGGCSIAFPAPGYESGIGGFPCGGKRSQPDVSLDADTNTGVSVVVNAAPELGGRTLGAIGGTSVAAPEMAAMWALVLQACRQNGSCVARGSGAKAYRLGNPNAYLYRAYTNAGTYANTFYDVTYGNNSLPGPTGAPDPGFSAGQGYDLVTGIGAPFGRNLIRAVVGV